VLVLVLVKELTDECVHVEDPMESVDLWEGWDVHWETAVWENYSEHFFDCVVKRMKLFQVVSLFCFCLCYKGFVLWVKRGKEDTRRIWMQCRDRYVFSCLLFQEESRI